MKPLHELSPEEKRVLAAEAMGAQWFTDKFGVRILSPLPDYGNDLNACAEMEKTLTMEECARYEELMQSADALPYPAGLNVWHSTAAQRLDAFLLAKGLAV